MDEEAPAKLAIKADGSGSLAFGCVQAELDSRMEDVGVAEHLAFSFVGTDEMDETSGRGWAVAIGKKLEGWLCFHLGEESSFIARKTEQQSGVVRPRGFVEAEDRAVFADEPATGRAGYRRM